MAVLLSSFTEKGKSLRYLTYAIFVLSISQRTLGLNVNDRGKLKHYDKTANKGSEGQRERKRVQVDEPTSCKLRPI
jgi:hypothetical protein